MVRRGRMIGIRVLLAWLALVSGSITVAAAAPNTPHVAVETAWSVERARPGDFRALAVVLNIAPGLHIYPLEVPRDSMLLPTTIAVVDAPAWLNVGRVQSPPTQSLEVRDTGELSKIQAYEGRRVFFIPFTVGPGAPVGDAAITVRVGYVACSDQVCYPPVKVDVPVTLHVVAAGADLGEPGGDDFRAFDATVFASSSTIRFHAPVEFPFFGWTFEIDASNGSGLAALLLLAAAGGLLLNLTPCVLPVIPIKIMGLSRGAGNRGRTLLLGAAMSAGVVAFWLGLAWVIKGISGFDAISSLFRYHGFTIGVGLFIAVMAVGMCGLFALRLPQWVYRINPKQDSVAGAVGFGVMTAVLSTPCTAPLMGAAAAWAVTQYRGVTLAVFGAIGVGMALPYLILSAFPRLVARMPRSGPASEVVKQVMGLLMLAAAAYFIGTGLAGWAVRAPDPPTKLYWWAVMGLIAAAGGWLAWRTWRITPSAARRVIFVGLGAVMIAGSALGAASLTSKGPIDWVYYTPDRLAHELKQGNAVVIDFTADWCLNCKVLEATVLHSDDVVAVLKRPGVTAMKVDLSGDNPDGWGKLGEVGQVAIPVLVVLRPNGTQVLNSSAYTRGQVIEAVEKAKK